MPVYAGTLSVQRTAFVTPAGGLAHQVESMARGSRKVDRTPGYYSRPLTLNHVSVRPSREYIALGEVMRSVALIILSATFCLVAGAILGALAGMSMLNGRIGIPAVAATLSGAILGLVASPLAIRLVRQPKRLLAVMLLCFAVAVPVAVVSGLTQDPLAAIGLLVATILSCYFALTRRAADASVHALVRTKAAYARPALCLVLATILAWSQHHYPDSPEDLIRVMAEDDMDRSLRAAQRLAASGKEPLLLALRHPDPRVRHQAARQLGFLRDGSVVGGLRDASKDPDRHVRMWVALALGQIGDPATLPTLTMLASDPEEIVRRNAAESIRRITDRIDDGNLPDR